MYVMVLVIVEVVVGVEVPVGVADSLGVGLTLTEYVKVFVGVICTTKAV